MLVTASFRTLHKYFQFSLFSLLEFVTICAVLSTCSYFIGIGASICLMLMAFSLWTRIGWLVLTLLVAASLAVGGSFDESDNFPDILQQFAVFLLTVLLTTWYSLRRKHLSYGENSSKATHDPPKLPVQGTRLVIKTN